MFSLDDTIVAIATPPGRAGIGVVRVSGPEAAGVARALSRRRQRFEPRYATLVRIEGASAADQALVTYFPAPHSYTGEDVVEISAHGSPVLLAGIVERAMACGARLAEPGEFTFRAYVKGRIDLVQAEAVRDLVDAVTPAQARAAFDQLEGTLTGAIAAIDSDLFALTAALEASLDFPEEGYHFAEPGEVARTLQGLGRRMDALLASSARGRLLREGMHVVMAGRPNAGKSSLFNALAGSGRAIVTDRPGTTRDLVAETVDVHGVPVTLVDTAGLHGAAADPVEVEGIARAIAARDVASVVIVVLDRSAALTPDDRRLLQETASRSRVVVSSKIDLDAAWEGADAGVPLIEVSAHTGHGLDHLRSALVSALTGQEPLRDVPAITNLRHAGLVTRARDAVTRAAAAAEAGTSEEFVLADLADARAALEEITGARTAADVLEAIFSTFCIGK